MKVSTILTIIMFLVALLGSIGGTSYYYTQCNKAMTAQVYEHLETVAQSRANHVVSFINSEINKLEMIGGGIIFVDFLESPERTNQNSEEFKKIKKRIDDLNIGVGVFDTNGVILVSENNLPGTDYSELEFFKNGMQGVDITSYYDKQRNENYVGMAKAVKNSNGEIIGAISLDIPLNKLNEITLDKTGLGETGETYLIKKDSYAITDLLFVDDAFLEWKVDTINSRNCFEHSHEYGFEHDGHYEEGEHEEVQVFLDYVGDKVIGTHYIIPKAGWCLLSEIDEEEILGNQRVVFQRVSLTIIISIVVVVTLIGFFVGKFIDKRIVLKKGGKKL